MRYLFIINPTAGKGNTQDGVVNDIKNHFKNSTAPYEIYFTKCQGDAQVVATREAQKGDSLRIFACGGEGTVFEILNGIVGYNNVELGVIPCGSANDFLRYFKTRKEFFDIADQISGQAVPTDIIKAGDKYCLNGCSVGMDAMVGRDMILFKNWPLVSGPLAYNLAIVKTFLNKLGVRIKVSVNDEKPENKDCLFAVITNGPCYGGGYTAAPKAVPFDNTLDFTLVDTVSRFKVLKFLGPYKKGEHEKFDFTHLRRCNSMEFWADTEIPVNLDGEIVNVKHLRFDIVKSGVKFVVPKSLENLIKNPEVYL